MGGLPIYVSACAGRGGRHAGAGAASGYEADVQKLRGATSQANPIHLTEQEESIRLSFVKMENGVPVPCSLRTIRTREGVHRLLVIGVKQEYDRLNGSTQLKNIIA